MGIWAEATGGVWVREVGGEGCGEVKTVKHWGRKGEAGREGDAVLMKGLGGMKAGFDLKHKASVSDLRCLSSADTDSSVQILIHAEIKDNTTSIHLSCRCTKRHVITYRSGGCSSYPVTACDSHHLPVSDSAG